MATPSSITIPERLLSRSAALTRAPGEPVTTEASDENGTETVDPAEDRSDDPDVEIHKAILARERAGGSFPDGDALEATDEPLHRLTSAAMLFSDVTAENTDGPEFRIRLSSTGGSDE